MSNGPRSTVPQWAPDPTGRHTFRYWDGAQWADDVSDDSAPPGDPPGAGPSQSLPTVLAAPVAAEPGTHVELGARHRHRERTRVRRSFWFGAIVGAGVIAAGAAIAVFVFNVSINSSSTTKRVAVTKTSTTQQPTTTTTINPGRPAAQVHLDILNASAIPGAAGTKAFALGALGYQIAAVGNATERQGSVVECKPGLDLEAATLAKKVSAGTTVAPFPTPAPTGSASADCVVVLGR
jgi:LytR cell envelope-related transcriptional attenuator/Protein of unknown function (DUF2510)